MNINLKNRNFLKLLDFTSAEITYLLDVSMELKKAKKTDLGRGAFGGNVERGETERFP